MLACGAVRSLSSLLVLLLVWLRAGPVAAADGRLVVRAPQYGLTVAVDRQPVGRTPLAPIAVAPGFHLVEVLRGGRAIWARLVFVTGGAALVLDVTLPAAVAPPAAATPPTGPSPPRIDLVADVALIAARLGGEDDLDLRQDWRLEGARLVGPDVDGAVRIAAWTDVDGEDAALASTHRPGTEMAVEEAWLGYGGRRARVEAGRLLLAGPGGVPLVTDGGRARLGDDVRLEALGGRLADPPFGAAGGLATLAAAGAGMSLRYLYFRAHHLDAAGAWDAGPMAIAVEGRAVDHAPALAGGRIGIGLGVADAWLSARRRFAADGPFEDPARWLGVLAAPPPAGWEAAAGAGLALAGFFSHATLEARRPDAPEPARIRGTVDVGGGGGVWAWGAAADALIAERAPAPTLRRSLGAHVSGALRGDPWRVELDLGLRQVRVDADRLLPEGSLRLGRRLASTLEVYAAATTGAVHPDLWPDAGPLSTLALGVALR